jgi:hypothetical protein
MMSIKLTDQKPRSAIGEDAMKLGELRQNVLLKLAAAVTAITLALASPVSAQRPLSANQLPKSGVANYEGTFTSTNVPDATGAISLSVDFGTGAVSADLTIPALTSDQAPRHFTPTGTIDVDGGFLISQNLTLGVDYLILISGNFFNAQAKNTEGQFIAVFCVTIPCNGVIRTRSGTFAAARVQ